MTLIDSRIELEVRDFAVTNQSPAFDWVYIAPCGVKAGLQAAGISYTFAGDRGVAVRRIGWTHNRIEKGLFQNFIYLKKRDLYPVHLGVISPPPSCVPVQMTCCYCNRCEPEIKCEVKEFDFQRKDGRFLSRITTFTSVLIFLLLAQCSSLVLRLHVAWHACPADARLCLRALVQSKMHVHAGGGGFLFLLQISPLWNQ